MVRLRFARLRLIIPCNSWLGLAGSFHFGVLCDRNCHIVALQGRQWLAACAWSAVPGKVVALYILLKNKEKKFITPFLRKIGTTFALRYLQELVAVQKRYSDQ